MVIISQEFYFALQGKIQLSIFDYFIIVTFFPADENTEGVPEFWLTIFKNVDMLADMVQDHDEPILKHLRDIKVLFQEANPMVRKLEVLRRRVDVLLIVQC